MNDERVFELALDQALHLLASGARRADCLRLFPEHAEALAPLLSAAEATRAGLLADQPIPAPNLTRGKQRFLEAAREQAPRPKLFMSLRLAALAFSLLVVMLVGVRAASARALPGDVLYPVKRGLERVQLALAFDPAARERMLVEQAERRRAETQSVLGLRRTTRVEFEGVVESMQEDVLVVSGFSVMTDQAAEFHVADQVRVGGVTTSAGAIIAEQITLLAPMRPAPTATARPALTHPAATVTPSPTQQLPTTAASVSPTARPTITPTQTHLTQTTPTEARPSLSDTPRVEYTPTLRPTDLPPTTRPPELTPTEARVTLNPTPVRRP